jgi:succinate dehydrogenase/fumarate reductase-like Fe-S protein
MANNLTASVGDGNSRPGIQDLPREGGKDLRSHADVLNHVSRYQTPFGHDHPRPARAVRTREVAKLIDVSKCIGCKACQTACMEWNDLATKSARLPQASTTTRRI